MLKRSLFVALVGLVLLAFGREPDLPVETTIRSKSSDAVALIHGVYQIMMPDGRVWGPTSYTGSGFLVREGWVASCRHVLSPWMDNSSERAQVMLGATPVFLHLTATFPGVGTVELDPASVRHSDTVDAAVARLKWEVDVEPLEMREDNTEGSGVHAYVLGYPLGTGPLACRLPPALRVGFPQFGDTSAQIAYLEKVGGISPLFFKGVINSSQRHLITTDAAMTFGCSGGPVLGDDGRVIGVNFAILPAFDGMNMVVPVRHIISLIVR